MNACDCVCDCVCEHVCECVCVTVFACCCVSGYESSLPLSLCMYVSMYMYMYAKNQFLCVVVLRSAYTARAGRLVDLSHATQMNMDKCSATHQ